MILSERDYSTIELINGIARKTLTPNKYFSLDFYRKSYENVMELQKTKFSKYMVKVISFKESGGKLVIDMEYLEGYKRVEYKSYNSLLFEFQVLMAKEGYIQIDFAPINVMEKDREYKVIDLDTIVKISDLPDKLIKADWMLSWFGSRVIKHIIGGKKWQDAL